ncbi:MAG: hypothetical protein K6G18_08655 [Treponema sp.]|nr:hypothetical protein [Treponema sp.]
MSYVVMEKAYNTLTEEQQLIVYNLTVALMNMNEKAEKKVPPKRTFGKFAGRAKAVFSPDWEMSEEELFGL